MPGLRGWVDRAGTSATPATTPTADGSCARPRASTPAWSSTNAIISDGILYPQRMKDMKKLLFESEIQHWLEKRELEDADAAQ